MFVAKKVNIIINTRVAVNLPFQQCSKSTSLTNELLACLKKATDGTVKRGRRRPHPKPREEGPGNGCDRTPREPQKWTVTTSRFLFGDVKVAVTAL